MVAWTLLLLDGGDVHGYKLGEELLARGLDLDKTSLYRSLRSFERDRWLTSRWAEPVAGPTRRVYSLTTQGRATLQQLSALIAATRDTYGMFLRAHDHAVADRVEAPAALGETTLPAARDSARSSDEQAVSAPATASALQPLRPHKELLAGWLLLRLDAGPTYGYELGRDFAAHQLTPDPATMYRMLRRLEADKWLQSRWQSSSAGPRRRFYRLTTRGRRNLDEIAALITAIRNLHDDYLREYEHAHRLLVAAAAGGADDAPPPA